MGTNAASRAADHAADQPANHAAPAEAGAADPRHSAGQLLVFAHGDEASAFADVPHLVTGVGKVEAATVLGKALADAREAGQPIRRVVVLGTAGIISDEHRARRRSWMMTVTTSVRAGCRQTRRIVPRIS